MKERPILFSAPMVRAILAGTKTQTRRTFNNKSNWHFIEGQGDLSICPYGQPGDRLWVREAWRAVTEADALAARELTEAHRLWYEADTPHQPGFGKLRPSIHMPRWASRITLEISDVRVERLNEISESDALAEGVAQLVRESLSVQQCGEYDAIDADAIELFRDLWEQINGPDSWDANPWVWVIEFRRLEAAHGIPT